MEKTRLLPLLSIVAILFFSFGCVQPSEKVAQGQNPDGTYWRGAQNPKVIIYEYSDFQCPNCKLAEKTVEQFISQYQSKGVQLRYKHFPLEQLHPLARPAAIAAVCAGKEGKFWEYHDILFENSPNLTNSDLLSYAAKLNLSSSFQPCLTSPDASAIVDADTAQALSTGFSGTPTYVIGDVVLIGNQPVEKLAQAADIALASRK